MNCPPEIAEILLQILRNGILRSRQAGWAGDSQRCAREADHIHNLPDLLANYSLDFLRFYWEIERPAFIKQSTAEDVAGFEPMWHRLSRHTTGVTDAVLTP